MAAAPPPHVFVLPFPAQGHVIPLMELSHRLVAHGFKIYFISTEFNHNRILKSLEDEGAVPDGIHMLSIPDGLDPAEDHTDSSKLAAACRLPCSGPLRRWSE